MSFQLPLLQLFNKDLTSWSLNITSRLASLQSYNVRQVITIVTPISTQLHSPGWRNREWKWKHCTLSEGWGLWCFCKTSTSSLKVFSLGLAGATRLRSMQLVAGGSHHWQEDCNFLGGVFNTVRLEEVLQPLHILAPCSPPCPGQIPSSGPSSQ